MRRLWCIAAGLLLLGGTGCGDGRATVTGSVTFNGEPVSRGSIVLVPVDGKGRSAGGDVENGRYTIRKVDPGEKTVQLSAQYVSGTTKLDGGLEVDVVSDLLPRAWGAESTERLTIVPPLTTKDYAIQGPDPRRN